MKRQGVVLGALVPGTTYVCEIVYEANLVVVNYPPQEEGVILVAAIAADGTDLARPELEAAGSASGLPVVRIIEEGAGASATHTRVLYRHKPAYRSLPTYTARFPSDLPAPWLPLPPP